MSVMVEYFDWTDDRIAFLRKRIAEGAGPSAIAREFQAETKSGIPTRNAVIGKCQRLGLVRANGAEYSTKILNEQRSQTTRLQHKRDKRPPRPPRETPPPPPSRAAAARLGPLKLKGGRTCQVVDLDKNMCKYPIGDPIEPDFAFCARGVDGGGPYCADHRRLCYDTPAKRAKQQDNAAKARAGLRKKIRDAAA